MKVRRLLLALLAVACGDDHGHDHAAPEPDELPGQSVTLWTERTELFMEYDPLIVGQEIGFAAHVTEMPSFKAVTAGAATITLTMDGGAALTGRADAPSNPGIFRPKVTPATAGKCTLSMKLEGPQLQDAFQIGPCVVYPDEKAARAALPPEEEAPGRISFLKEQQWKTDFATAPVTTRELQAGVRASGEIQAVSGKEARLAAPTAGRLALPEPAPVLGMPVKKGQVLATISARLGDGADRSSLEAEVAAARAEVSGAEAQVSRAERLLAENAIPAKQLEEARTRLTVARARLSGAGGRLSQYTAGASGSGGGAGFQIRAPLDGILTAMDAATGQTVEEGTPLFTVADLDRVWVTARVFEPDIPRIENARSAWFTIDGYGEPFVVDETNGKLVTIGRAIDPETRTVPVIFERDNTDGRLRLGQFAKVWIATGAPRKALAVPDAALVDEAGKQVVYVMIEGESFERRPLTLGIRSNGWSEVLDGLAEGERVVTRGAYEIRLSAASGVTPAHGHAH